VKKRKSKLGIQALNPVNSALEFQRQYKARVFKVVIVNDHDFVNWWLDFPDDTLVIGRFYGTGNIDRLEWTPENGIWLADRLKQVAGFNKRIDVWECVNEPIVGSVADMQRLAEFERVWADRMHEHGLKTIVGNFSVGNPADISLMKHFRPAMEAGDYFAYHAYGRPPHVLSDAEWWALRYRKLLEAAEYEMPVLLTEGGIDAGGCPECGYQSYMGALEYIEQLK